MRHDSRNLTLSFDSRIARLDYWWGIALIIIGFVVTMIGAFGLM